MKFFFSPGRLALFALAALFCIAGCQKTPTQIAKDTNQAGTQDQSTDPATANLAPVETASNSAAPSSPAASPAAGSAPAPAQTPAPAQAPAQASSASSETQSAQPPVPCVSPTQVLG
ncbi:MAG TPA: hypothetical protein VGE83_05690, partial [Terracidiphilus sp.]